MELITSLQLNAEQKQQALNIWNAEYPVRVVMTGMAQFDAFLEPLVNLKHYLLYDGEVLAGWAATYFINEVRCFFIMLNTAYQGKGYGTLLLNELKNDGHQLFGWAIDHNDDVKADGSPYPSPVGFYKKNGFIVNNDLRLEDEQLSAVNILWNRGE